MRTNIQIINNNNIDIPDENILINQMNNILANTFINKSIQDIKNSAFFQQLQEIYDVCNKFVTYLEYIVKNLKMSKSSDTETVLKLGTIILFKLRQFFTKEQLIFVVGGEVENDKGIVRLGEKKYNQDYIFNKEYLKNLRISYSDGGAILIAGFLENIEKQLSLSSNLANNWNLVKKYGWISHYLAEATVIDEFTEKGRKYQIYRKNDKDTRVYARWTTNRENKQKNFYHYYFIGENFSLLPRDFNEKDDLKNNNFLFYNQGWLYQWLKIQQEKKIVNIDEKAEYPLLEFMTNEDSIIENVPGIRGGDYKKEQYKFGNQQIISFNNIIEVFKGGGKGKYKYNGLLPSMKNLLNSVNKEEIEKNLSNIYKDFISDHDNDNKIKNFVKNNYKNIIEEFVKLKT